MSSHFNFDLRYTDPADLEYLKRWVSHPDILKWMPMGSDKEIEDAANCWIGFYRFKCSLTAVVDGIPCGMGTLFLMPYRKVAHQAMCKIVVDPSFQRRGIGTSIVKNLKQLAKNYFSLEFLNFEVFEHNPLIKILENQGFQEIVRQDNYVKDGENYYARIVLEVDLKRDHI